MNTQRNWETAMGMQGYRGSPAEKEDRADGIKVGGQCIWLAAAPGGSRDDYPVGTIYQIDIDEDGDPRFHLSFDNDHKDVVVDRECICKVIPRLEQKHDYSDKSEIVLMTDELVQQIARLNGFLTVDMVRQCLLKGDTVCTNFRSYRLV